MARPDKLAKLLAVFEHFHNSIALLDDPIAKRLIENWARVRYQCVTPEGVSRATLAAGMEQGLREMKALMEPMPADVRRWAVLALAEATATHYADLLVKDAERLAKIWARGFIRGNNDYYLIRHQVDLLEGVAAQEQELRVLYGLIDAFEGRGA